MYAQEFFKLLPVGLGAYALYMVIILVLIKNARVNFRKAMFFMVSVPVILLVLAFARPIISTYIIETNPDLDKRVSITSAGDLRPIDGEGSYYAGISSPNSKGESYVYFVDTKRNGRRYIRRENSKNVEIFSFIHPEKTMPYIQYGTEEYSTQGFNGGKWVVGRKDHFTLYLPESMIKTGFEAP